ncbi:aminoglycoside phosphotransferase family protein [Nocardioides perillae]|uniref:Streptomycin 6-kinase n=1 Tax=Nocardioides perillae TaxID=1119534 RepID=A0A7Y9RT19_9ACTN|nr:streptomycin 6-kinase [Nocardioides perillae]
MASLGAAGAAWAAALPATLALLCERWGLELERALPGGSASYVVGVRTRDGEPRVLKVATPDSEVGGVAALLRAADGRGHVRLHAVDLAHRALLLERLGPSLEQTPLAPEEKVRLLATTLAGSWLPVAAPWVAPAPGADRALLLLDGVARRWREQGAPASPRVLRAAEAAGRRRAAAFDPLACVVTHGDPHPANLLRVEHHRPGALTGWVLVDGEGVVAEPAYDVGVALRDLTGALGSDPATACGRLRGWCDLAAGLTGTDPDAVWDWALLERVSTGLYVLGFGGEAVGRRLLASAELLT